jgi:Tfp pilus assembly protein PilF
MEYVAQAQEAQSVGNIEDAQRFMHEALTLAPRDADVLTAFGGMLADVGNYDKALLTLWQAVRIAPDHGFEKYMCAFLSREGDAKLFAGMCSW